MLMDANYAIDSSPTHIIASPTSTAEGRKASGGDTADSPVAGTIVEFPTQFDVMMGRGIGPNEHPGNRRYRTIVHSFQPEYLATKKRKEKEKIARKAIRTVKANGARFIKPVEGALATDSNKEGPKGKNKHSKRWVVVEKETVLEKTKQALRFVGHYHNKNRKSGDSSEGDDSSDGGTSPSKTSRPAFKSKGQEYAMGSIDRGTARQRDTAPLMRREGPRPPSPVAPASSRFPAPHHLLPSASTLLSHSHHPAPLSSQVPFSSLFRRQQLQQEMIANQEQIRRAVAAGLGGGLGSAPPHGSGGSSSSPVSAAPSLHGGLGLGPIGYGGLGDPLRGDLSRIALLLRHTRRPLQEQVGGAGDPTNVLLQRMARSSADRYPLRAAQPNLSTLDRLLLGLPPVPSSLDGGMSNAWPQGGPSAAPSLASTSPSLLASSRSADATNMLRSLMMPTSRENLPTGTSVSGLAGEAGTTNDGLLAARADSQRSDTSSRLSSQGDQNVDLSAQNSALLSLLRQRQQHTTNDMSGPNHHRPPADLMQALASQQYLAEQRRTDRQPPPDPSRRNDYNDGSNE
jgi:hypothetical protein